MHPYRIAGAVLGVLALLFVGFLVVGLLLPGGWTVEREAEMEASPAAVFAYLERAAAWEEWTPSPETGVELFGPDAGPGSGRRWDDPGYGEGEFTIAVSDPPERLAYEVAVEGGSIRIQGVITLEEIPGGTRVVWREEGDFGWNPLLGYLAGRMDELQGAQMESSLSRLRSVVEAAVSDPPG